MKPKSFLRLASTLSIGAVSFITFSGSSAAATFTKGDNTSALDLAASWGGTAPGATDTANWSGTYNTAGSLGAALPGASISWQGISAGALSGTAAGVVSIGGTGAAVVSSSLAIGSSGINMTGANQNLVLNAATLDFSTSQTWTVPAGRNLRLASSGTGAANSNVDGTGGAATVITVAGGGVVDANQGATNGFTDYTGKWIVETGTTLRGVQSGTAAWGSNTDADAILLKGGKLAVGGITGAAGNWTWPAPITLGTGTTSTISGQNPDTSTRTLAIQGLISGDGNLVFEKTSGGTLRVSLEQDANTFSGTTAITGTGVSANLTVQGLLGTGSGLKTPLGTGDISVTAGATLEFKTATASNSDFSIGNNINLNASTLRCTDAFQTYSGTITLTGANTIISSTDQKTATFNGYITEGVTPASVAFKGTGSQQMILPFANTYSGGTTLGNDTSNDGIVVLGDVSAVGSGTLTLRGAQIRAMDPGFIIANNLAVGAGGLSVGGTNDISFTSIAVVDSASRPFVNFGTAGVTLSGINLSSGTAATASFGSTTAKGPFNVTGPITGTGKVEVKGGIVTLSGASSYSGTTTVSSIGRLNLTGSLASSITMTGVSASIIGSGSTTGGLTTTGASAGTIYLDPANPTQAVTANAVAFNGATKVDLLGQQTLGTTTYTVVKYGTLAGLANLSTSNTRGTFTNDTVNKKVTLAVTSANRTWNHSASTTWNLTDINWAEGDNKYFNGDAVTFGDAGAGSVTLSGSLAPYSVTFNNTAGNDYTLTSSTNNLLTGPTGLTVSGSGTTQLVGANTFTGKIQINAGTLAFQADNNLGAVPAAIVTDLITLNGGTLKFNPSSAANLTLGTNRGITLGASGGTIDTTAITSSFTATVAGDIVGTGPLTLFANGDTTDTGAGLAGATILSGLNTYIGPVTIKSGVVSMSSYFGETTNLVFLDGGGLVDQNQSINFNQGIRIGTAGGVLRTYGSATSTFSGTIANAPSVTNASIRLTDAGTRIFSGDGSAFAGTITNSRGSAFFDSEDWSGTNLVSVDGTELRFGSGLVTKVKSITADNNIQIESGTTLDITTGNFTVQPGLASSNFSVSNTGTLTSSSGTLTLDFQTPYTTAGADNQQIAVLIADYDGATPLAVVKNGAGAITNFNTVNTYTGGTTVNAGRINVTNINALGTGPVTVNPGGQLYLGLAAAGYLNDMTLAGTGPTEPAGNLGALRYENNTTSGNLTIAPSGARLGAYNGSTGTINGTLGGSGNLEINSSSPNHNGTITLAAVDSGYSGMITVSQGRLDLNNALGGSLSVSDGATLGGEDVIGGTLTLGTTSGANLRVPGATAISLETDNLILNGVTTLHLDSLPTPIAPVTVVKYNTLTGGVANLQVAPGALYRAAIVDTGTTIDLNFVTAARTWAGTVDGNWNSTTLNWVEGDKKFFTGDSVVFNDGAANKTVAIPSPVTPASVLFNNSAGNNYTVTGKMQINDGGSLTKQGAGSVTLTGTPSNVTGPVQIDGGSLVLGTSDYARAVGSSTGIVINAGTLRLNGINVLYDGGGATNVTVNPGGAVELNAYHSHFKTLSLNGGTVLGITSNVAGSRFNNEYSTFDTSVTVGGSQMSTISRIAGGTGVFALGGAPFNVGEVVTGTDLLVSAPFASGSLIKDGAGTMELTAANTYAGTTTINAGILLASNTAGSAAGTGAITVKNGGTLGGTGGVTGAVTVESGGKLAPGTSIESLATGALNLAAGSVFLAEINSSGTPAADVATVTGNVTLAGTLTVTDIAGSPAAITAGTKLTLITYTGTLTGTFAGLAEAAVFSVGSHSFKIRYNDAKKVTLESMSAGGTDYDLWAAAFAPLGAANADDDGDGLANGEEYAFGLHPKNGASVSPVTVPLGKTAGTFTYTRRKPSLTGLTYRIWTSTGLSSWTQDTGAIQTPTDAGDNQTVIVTLSGTKPLTAPKLFVRVTAE